MDNNSEEKSESELHLPNLDTISVEDEKKDENFEQLENYVTDSMSMPYPKEVVPFLNISSVPESELAIHFPGNLSYNSADEQLTLDIAISDIPMKCTSIELAAKINKNKLKRRSESDSDIIMRMRKHSKLKQNKIQSESLKNTQKRTRLRKPFMQLRKIFSADYISANMHKIQAMKKNTAKYYSPQLMQKDIHETQFAFNIEDEMSHILKTEEMQSDIKIKTCTSPLQIKAKEFLNRIGFGHKSSEKKCELEYASSMIIPMENNSTSSSRSSLPPSNKKKLIIKKINTDIINDGMHYLSYKPFFDEMDSNVHERSVSSGITPIKKWMPLTFRKTVSNNNMSDNNIRLENRSDTISNRFEIDDKCKLTSTKSMVDTPIGVPEFQPTVFSRSENDRRVNDEHCRKTFKIYVIPSLTTAVKRKKGIIMEKINTEIEINDNGMNYLSTYTPVFDNVKKWMKPIALRTTKSNNPSSVTDNSNRVQNINNFLQKNDFTFNKLKFDVRSNVNSRLSELTETDEEDEVYDYYD